MARLARANRLRWPRPIMVSMTSLRNRLAEAPSPSSPLRSRYSHAIWNEVSRSWESETVMSKKPTRTARVPCHLRFGARFPTSIATGSDRKMTSPNTWASGVSRASQTAKRGSRQSRPKASCMDAICQASSSVSAATMAIRRLDRPRSLSAAGARRNSVRVSRTSTARSGTISSFSPSVSGSQPAHGEFDRSVRQFTPLLDLAHVGGLRIRPQEGLCLDARLFPWKRERLPDITVGLATACYAVGEVPWAKGHVATPNRQRPWPYMFVRTESESSGLRSRFHRTPPMDQQGRPNEPQLVYRRDPETGQPVEGLLRWGLIPHFCEKRPDFV